jgi:hypothetical protein
MGLFVLISQLEELTRHHAILMRVNFDISRLLFPASEFLHSLSYEETLAYLPNQSHMRLC